MRDYTVFQDPCIGTIQDRLRMALQGVAHLTIPEAAKAVGASYPTTKTALARMIRRGLVRSSRDPGDRRVVTFALRTDIETPPLVIPDAAPVAPAVSRPSRGEQLHTLLTAMPGLATDECADRLGVTYESARRALEAMRRAGRVRSASVLQRDRQRAVWYAVAVMAPAPGQAPVQDRVLAIVDGTLRTTADLADAAGITRSQAKNALAYLANKGRVVRVKGRRMCSWVLPGAIEAPAPEPADDWTPRPWVHPIRARALGLPSPLTRKAA